MSGRIMRPILSGLSGGRLANRTEAIGTPAASVLWDPQKKAAIRSGALLAASGVASQTSEENRTRKRLEKRNVLAIASVPTWLQIPESTLWQKAANTMNTISVLLVRLNRFFDAIAQFRTRGRMSWPSVSGSRTRSASLLMSVESEGPDSTEETMNAAQSSGVTKIPSTLERTVENKAAELSPSLFEVMTIADEIVVGSAAR